MPSVEAERNHLDESHEVLDAIRRLVQVMRRSAYLAESRVGMSAAQLFVLRKLAEVPTLSVGELARRTATNQSSVSEVVQHLVASGHAFRERSTDDRRSVLLSISESGRALVEGAPQVIEDHILNGLSRVSATDRTALAKLLNRLLKETGFGQPPTKTFFEDDVADELEPSRSK